MATTIETHPSQWDPPLDAVAAAPAHHKVIFENDRLRVLEVRARFEQLSKAEARRQLPWQQDEADIWLPSDAGSIDELIA